MSLFRLLCDDDGLANALGKHLHPWYFENEALAWAYSYCQRHVEQYGGMPSLGVVLQKARTMDPRVGPVYAMVIEEVMKAPLRDEQWLRDSALDFVKRNLFARTFAETRELYNSGKVDAAYDLMMERMEALHATTWEQADRGWVADNFTSRNIQRAREDPSESAIPTGFNWLDHILHGGLSLGELGLWIAYSKIGKTTMLVQHGKCAVRNAFIPTAHFVFEGSRKQVEARYDASFSGELYVRVKTGDITSELYDRAVREYQMHKGRLVVTGFTDSWDYTVRDIDAELKALRRGYGFVPKLVIVDYGDLLTGRDKRYRSEYEKQKAAYRDLKSLANRGYAVWTASQAQRPEKGKDEEAHFVKSRQVADAYDKVRVADFIGSLNQTLDEKTAGVMRLYAEMYRDNAAGQWLAVQADLERMIIKQVEGIVSPSTEEAVNPSMNWSPPVQTQAPI
jgi:hypothetical protein